MVESATFDLYFCALNISIEEYKHIMLVWDDCMLYGAFKQQL